MQQRSERYDCETCFITSVDKITISTVPTISGKLKKKKLSSILPLTRAAYKDNSKFLLLLFGTAKENVTKS